MLKYTCTGQPTRFKAQSRVATILASARLLIFTRDEAEEEDEDDDQDSFRKSSVFRNTCQYTSYELNRKLQRHFLYTNHRKYWHDRPVEPVCALQG